MYPRTLHLSILACSRIGENLAKLSSIEQLMFFWLKPSEADPKIATSSTPASIAASYPRIFGVNAVYAVPSFFEMPAITAAASAICGTHLGLTKLVVSMWENPQFESMSTNLILSSVAMRRFWFCKPSLGPTSNTFT